jgi:AbrB family looped-hinge helix DNA binding protein
MNSVKSQKKFKPLHGGGMEIDMINVNLHNLRMLHDMTQEEVAEKIGVSRQAVAKWENGESTPDILKCSALADLYGTTIDELVNHKDDYGGVLIEPRGKHIFGTVTLNERGQIVIPKKARDLFDLKSGDTLVLLGDEKEGLALIKSKHFEGMLDRLSRAMRLNSEE